MPKAAPMQGSFELEEYAAYLGARWRALAVACGVAALFAVGITLLLPLRYTAESRVLIEAPLGTDPRAPQAVSPQYIELLKTYEQFATSDSLFQEAVDKFGLREAAPNRTVEDWKQQILEAAMVGNTRVLQISVTLTDAAKAQAMAQYLAERTIELSLHVSLDADQQLIREAESRKAQALQEYEAAEEALSQLRSQQPAEVLASRVKGLELRRARIERNLVDLESDITESNASAVAEARQRLAAERANVEEDVEESSRLLAIRQAAQERATVLRDEARGRFADAQQQLDTVRSTSGMRGERLQLIDVGIVPESTSSPSMALNVIAAVVFALVAAIMLLTIRFSLRRPRAVAHE